MSEIPDGREYLESREWTIIKGGAVKIGISGSTQDELGDIVFIEFPAEDNEPAAGGEPGVIENIKAVSDLYASISGMATAASEELSDAPELLNGDPYGDGWMFAVGPADMSEFDDLLSPEGYREQTEWDDG